MHSNPNTVIFRVDHAALVLDSAKHGRREALVSLEDVRALRGHRWTIGTTYKTRFYVVARRTGGSQLYIHRFLAGVEDGVDVQVDHINGDPLDNRRENLRVVTRRENLRNRGRPSTNKSGYKGVCWHVQSGRWRAYGKAPDRQVALGLFADVHEAGRAAHAWRAVNFPSSPEAREPFSINERAASAPHET